MPTPNSLAPFVFFDTSRKEPLHQPVDRVSQAIKNSFPRCRPSERDSASQALHTILAIGIEEQHGVKVSGEQLDISDFTIQSLVAKGFHEYHLKARLTVFVDSPNPVNGDKEIAYQFDLACYLDKHLVVKSIDTLDAVSDYSKSCRLL